MANSSESQIISANPIGSGLDAIRSSASSLIKEQPVLSKLEHGALLNLTLDLILTLQMLPASRLLPSRSSGRNLFADLSRLSQSLNSGGNEVSCFIPLVESVLNHDNDETIWAEVYKISKNPSQQEEMISFGHIGQQDPSLAVFGTIDGSEKLNPKRTRLPKSSIKILRQWCDDHLQHPYPTSEEKVDLMDKTGLTSNQLSRWFVNARRRGTIKPRRASDSLPEAPHSSSIQCPQTAIPRNWDTMTPLDRWRHSPPEYEAASMSSISRAVAHSAPNSFGSHALLEFLPAPSVSSFGSSNSSGSATSGHSSIYSLPVGPLDGFDIKDGQRRRRRRKRNMLTQQVPQNKTDRRPYQCTFCTDTFKTKFDWTRHEKSLHLSLETWICTRLGPINFSEINNKTTCVFCGISDPSNEHLESHNYEECRSKPKAARTFYRKDHLQQHLRLVHSVDQFLPSMVNWKSEITQVRSRCGFCDKRFIEWSDRNNHLASHFQAGAHIKEWKGCRGLDPAVALLVQNAMPPYLIGVETTALIPFSATKLGGGPNEQAPQPTSFESLTERLGQFVKIARETDLIVTDELLQQEARRIVYGDDDPWNQTAADNPQWLNFFKQGHGLHNADNQSQGLSTNTLTIPDLSVPWSANDWMTPTVQNTMLSEVEDLMRSNAAPLTTNLANFVPYAWQSPECLAEFRQRSFAGQVCNMPQIGQCSISEDAIDFSGILGSDQLDCATKGSLGYNSTLGSGLNEEPLDDTFNFISLEPDV